MTSDPVERFFVERTARLNRRARLRTMTPNEVVDNAVRIYQQLGWTFLKATVTPTLFVVAAFAFVLDYVLPMFRSTSDGSSLTNQFGEVAFAVGLAFFVGGPLLIVGVSATTAIVTHLVSDYMLGNLPSIDGAMRAARRTVGTLIRVHFWELFVSSIGLIAALGLSILSSLLDKSTDQNNAIAGLTAGLAVFAFIGGGLLFLIILSRHALVAPIAVLEGLKPRAAAKRSVELLKGGGAILSGYNHVWTLYVVLFFVSLLVGVGLGGFLSALDFEERFASSLSNIPYSGLLLKVLGLIPLFLWVWTMVPIWATTIAIIYYERRIRWEGYDIEALAADVWRTDRQTRFEL